MKTIIISNLLALLVFTSSFASSDYSIRMKTGSFTPVKSQATEAKIGSLSGDHIIVQFDGPLTEADRQALASSGLHVQSYIPNHAYTARLDEKTDATSPVFDQVRWLDKIDPVNKISPDIFEYGIFDWARRGKGLVQFAVVLHRDEDGLRWQQKLAYELNADIIGHTKSTNAIDLIIPEGAIYRLSEMDGVLWIEQATPYPIEDNNDCRLNLGVDALEIAPWNLDGYGVFLSEWDGGQVMLSHPDFGGRVQVMEMSTETSHATHVAGTVLGSGALSGGTYRGMAPAARLLTWLWWSSGSEAENEYEMSISARSVRIGTNSWSYGVGDPATESSCEAIMGNYFSVCSNLDNIVRGSAGAPVTIVWSAGNQRGGASKYCGSLGWTNNTVPPPATSKNVITVGAVNSNNNSMTSFSSWGPLDDGRIKPDVVGPGCQTSSDYGVTSTNLGGGYTVKCGTSMSAPSVAGLIALIYQQFDNMFPGDTVLSSTIKGILINSAEDFGRAGPDYEFGHGHVNGVAAVTKVGFGEASYASGGIATGEVDEFDLTVTGGTEKLKVTLVWDDPGGTASSSVDLINDLDLTLVDPFSGEEFPFVVDPANPDLDATRGVDRRNNVETVEVEAPYPGLWIARVSGYNVPDGTQEYSIVFSPDGLHTPGNQNALVVSEDGPFVQQPGEQISAEFYVTNVGAQTDSFSVDVNSLSGWLLSELTDSIVILAPYDSALIALPALVPALSLAGEY
ncbi:MAG: S8 family serine peptidase, partial [candidate division Zixibacteria bacterium]